MPKQPREESDPPRLSPSRPPTPGGPPTAEQETPLIPRRIPALPKLRRNSGAGDETAAPASASRDEGGELGRLLLPPSASGLAPLILAAGMKPPPPSSPPNKFQRLKRTVARRLGSLDPAWLRRCQGTPEAEGRVPGAAQEGEGGEVGWVPPEREGGTPEPSVGGSERKRPRGADSDDGGAGAAGPAKLRRCRRGSAEGAFGAAAELEQSEKGWEEEEEEEEEERAAVPTESGKPSENLPGALEEEEEKPRSVRRAGAAGDGNFVRLNLKKKSHVRGYAPRGNRLRRQVRKQKWLKKAERFGGGSVDRSSDVCFKCGARGHWATTCRGRGKALNAGFREPAAGPPPPEEEGGRSDEEEEAPLPTLEEVARRTNTVCRELSASGGSEREGSGMISETATSPDVRRPEYDPPTPPAPMEPLYSPGPAGKVPATPAEVREALKALGYSSFRPGQESAVMRILSGLSTLVVLPTGMGKSLCYQLPAYLYHKRSKCVTLVVSPLVSLMDDQVSGLPSCLKAVCVHSNMTQTQREAAMEKVRRGEVQILLLSPEALVGGSGWGCGYLPTADRLPAVAFACIDEAHCVSEWSHNFRPCYLRLCKVLRARLGVRCFLGLTATATLATARDVAHHLGIAAEDGIAARSAAVPPNLRLSVSEDEDRDQALVSLLRGNRFGRLDSVIVYCTRREETVRVAALIRTRLRGTALGENGETGRGDPQKTGVEAQNGRRPLTWMADAYHAGLSAAERRRVQKSFMSGRLRVVVATVAFGMGLDKPDVRGVVHYNMPKNFESYVQEIGRAGRDGEPAHCHLFLDPEGGDLHELRRHIYGDAVDFFTVKKLVQKVFTPCKCLELHRKHRDVVRDGEVEEAATAERRDEEEEEEEEEEEAGGATRRRGQRVCYKHERAIPVQQTVESLDLREEAIETLLSYLELHPRRWLELLPPTYSTCRLLCYGGPRQLRAAARSSPPVAVFLARERLAGRDHGNAGSLEFDVVSLSDSMGWETALVKRGLRQLQWDPRLRRGGRGEGKNGIVVEFGDLSFHLRAYGDLSDRELDAVCDYLHRRVVAREKTALGQLRACFRAFRSVAFQTCDPHPEEEEEERSSRLKALLRDYFEKEPGREEEEEEPEEELGTAKLPEWESQIRADIRRFLALRQDEKFSGRAVARIFHGIGSPSFPAQVYGRDRRFWRKYLAFDFHRLARLATEEILASR